MNYEKALCLTAGFVCAWVALYTMLAYFYEGVLQATTAQVQAGIYSPATLGGWFPMWMMFILLSAAFFGIGLSIEKK